MKKCHNPDTRTYTRVLHQLMYLLPHFCMSYTRFTSVVLAVCTAFVVSAQTTQAKNPGTIVDIAIGAAPEFTSLVDAVASQGLVPTLQSEGPFTVFAPTNRAFERLPSYITRAVEKNPALLKDILLAHVVPGEFRAADVVAMDSLTTAGGSELDVRIAGNRVSVGRARVVQTDILASNGVIHVIDRVIITPEVRNAALSILVGR